MDAYPIDHWSLVTAVNRADTASQRRLIAGFLRHYRSACVEHLRRTVRVVSISAEDVVELFAADQWVHDAIRVYVGTPASGLRGFVRDLLTQYAEVCDDTRYEVAQPAVVETLDPFDQEWARQVLSESLLAVKDRCVTTPTSVWELSELELLRPLLEGTEDNGGSAMVNPASGELIRLFQQAMRVTIAEYVCNAADAAEEERALKQIACEAGLALCRLF